MNEELYINNEYIPLSKSINPSLTKSITDIAQPDKRKATFSKTTTIPNSKEAQEVFGKIFELNLVNSTFNPTVKADVLYLVNGEQILNGYCQLKTIRQVNKKEIEYDIVMFGSISNIFREMGEKFLNDADMIAELEEWNHPFNKSIQADSWATQVWNNDLTAFVPFALGQGYVYPLIDYGLSTNLNEYWYQQIPCALYAKEYVDAIFSSNGFTYTSNFFDSTYFKSLIVPSPPSSYQLSDSDIENLQFAANTPILTSTGTTTSNPIAAGPTFTTPDKIRFTVDVADPSGLYDTATGDYTIISSAFEGIYDINALIDVTATFTPLTGASVVTTSDIQGGIYIYKNGVPIMGKPFYITFDDYPLGFSVGARSTSATPSYPDGDYLDGASTRYSQTSPASAAINIPRNVNPPDRIFLTLNNVYLDSGDVIDIRWKARYEGLNGDTQHCFEDIGGAGYGGIAEIDISVGAFSNIAKNTYLAENATLEVEKIIPRDIKQKDFLMSLVKMFNLWIDIDPNNDKNFLIEPREDFLGGTVLNIEEKLAHDRELNKIPMGKLDASDYFFSYKPDKDYYNEKYTSTWQEIYGERAVESTNEFVQSEKKTELVFSPTPIVAPPNNDRPVPTIIQVDDQNQPIETDHNIRILYYGGLKPCLNTWQHIRPIGGWPYIPDPTTYSTYPYAGHWDDPYNPTEDINFGLVKEVYYDDNLNPITVTNNNLYNKYYSRMINQYTDKDSKIVEGWFNVRPNDFKNWDFSKLYWFENAYFRLQKIENYNPTGNDLTKCVFLYLTDAPEFTSTTIPVIGGSGDVPVGGGGIGTVDDSESKPVKSTKTAINPDNNNTTGKGVFIQGSNNGVANDSYYININGDGNKVFSEAENIDIHGDNNTIEAGVKNVTLINTNGLTIEESNVTYIDGQKVNPSAISQPTDVEEVSSNTTYDPDVRAYVVDTSGGDVTITFDPSSFTYPEGTVYYIKKESNANELFVNGGGATIDGQSEITIKKDNTTMAVISDGTNFKIV